MRSQSSSVSVVSRSKEPRSDDGGPTMALTIAQGLAGVVEAELALHALEQEQPPEPLGLVGGLGRPQPGGGAAQQVGAGREPLGRVVGDVVQVPAHAHAAGGPHGVELRHLVDVALGDLRDRCHPPKLCRPSASRIGIDPAQVAV